MTSRSLFHGSRKTGVGGNATKETVSMLLESDSDMSDGETVLSDLKYKNVEGNGKKQTKKTIGNKKGVGKRR